MSRTWVAGAIAAAVLAAACNKAPSSAAATARMEIRKLSGNTVQFIPAPDQLPYCLIYTQSDKGVTRQLTMTRDNTSVPCPAGEPVLGLRYRIPIDEGRVHVQVLFSDQPLQSAVVADQVVEMAKPTFTPMDLRLPGRVLLETLDFLPSEEPATVVGAVLATPADGGSMGGAH
jgi:hypothetical protein